MSDVFISYSRKDKAFVQRLFVALETQGHDAWVDWEDIEYAEDWWQKIQNGIAEADHFVFIVSPHSARSKVCFDEAEYAASTGKRIVPVIFTDVDDPVDQERMHPALKRHNWLLFRPTDDFDATFASLLETIRREPEHVRMHTRLLVNAQEWVAGSRNPSLLLRGDNLQQAERWLQTADGKSPAPTELHSEYLAASHQAERKGRRNLIVSVALGLGLVLVLAVAALGLWQQNQRAEAVQGSLDIIESARVAYNEGRIFDALALAVEANQLDNPPVESVNTLREIAGSPGPVALFEQDVPVSAIVVSPDGSQIFAGYADGSLRLWDTGGGGGIYRDARYVLPDDQWHSEQVNSVAFSPDGRFAASTACAAHDPESDEPDNTCIAPEVWLWEIVGDELVLRYRLNPIDPDDNFATRVLSSNAFEVRFSPNPRDHETLVLGLGFGHAAGPVTLAFSFEDSRAISPPFMQIWQRDGAHGRDVVTALDFSLSGDEVLSGDITGGLRYWQGSGNDPSSMNGFDGRVTDIAISPDSESFRGSRPFLAASTDGTVRKGLASNNDDTNPLTFLLGDNGTGDPFAVNAVAYSPDGNFALAAVDNGDLVLLDMLRGQAEKTLRAPSGMAFTDVDYGTLTDCAVSSSADGTLIMWDMAYTDLAEMTSASALLDWLTQNRYVPDSLAASS
jgi:WD40 repeat protein